MAHAAPLHVAWLEVPHPGLSYYEALRAPLESLGHNITFLRSRSTRGFDAGILNARLPKMDVAFASFGFFPMEQGALPHLHEFLRPNQNESLPQLQQPSLCGVVPLVVLINKEYALMQQKLAWLRTHCVESAMSVHHDIEAFEQQTGVPFHRIWFGVDVGRFARPATSASSATDDGGASNPSGGISTVTRYDYTYDLGFTGVVRADQTQNWRYRIWKQAWPVLMKRGLRLFSGPKGGVHIGVAHAEVNQSEYVTAMRGSKLWLSTTGPSDLVGTRYFEVMATGVTLCVCNRMANDLVYSSLGIKENRHVVMFSSVPEFIDVVANYTTLPEYEERRLAIVQRAQELAMKKFSWLHVAQRVEHVLRKAAANKTREGGGHPRGLGSHVQSTVGHV